MMKKKILSLLVALCLLLALSAALSSCGSGGTAWISGTDDPSAELSANVGDFYFDEDDCKIYKLTNEGWLLLSEIKGEKGDKGDAGTNGQNGAAGIVGPAGAKWFSGTEVTGTESLNSASVAGARVGDMYFNSETGAVYQCVEMDKWEYVSNLTGAAGAPGAPGAPGTPGAPGEPGEPGTPGVGVEDIEIVYDVDDDGRKIAIFTVKYTDGSDKVITVLMPLEIQGIDLAGNGVVAIGEEMDLEIRVHYEDGTMELVPVTEDMFSDEGDIPDTDEAGEYYCVIKYKGAEVYTMIYVVDPTDTTVRGISAVRDNLIIYTSGDVPVLESLDVEFEATLANMTTVGIDASELEFDTSYYQGEGRPFTLRFALKDNYDVYGEMTVLPVENVNNFDHELARAEKKSGNTILCPAGGDLAEGDDTLVTLVVFVEGVEFTREVGITGDMLVSEEDSTPFSSDTVGVGYYRVLSDALCGIVLNEGVSVEVYDPAALTFSFYNFGQNLFRVGEGSFDDIEVAAVYVTAQNNYLSVEISLDAEMIILGEIDFAARGRYTATMWYDANGNEEQDGGEATTFYVEIYDPDYCNVKDVYAGVYIDEAISAGTSLEEFLAENIVGKNLYVSYYEEVGGMFDGIFEIEREWINTDLIEVDGDGNIISIGRVYVTVFYKIEGQEASVGADIYFSIEPDMSSATLLGSYCLCGTTVDLDMSSFDSFAIYDNGVAIIEPGDYEVFTTCRLGDGVAIIDYEGDSYVFALTSEAYGEMMPGYYKATVYAPTGEGVAYASSVADGFSDMFEVVVFEDYLVIQLDADVALAYGLEDKLIFTFKTQLGEGTEYSMMRGNTRIEFNHEAKTFALVMGR